MFYVKVMGIAGVEQDAPDSLYIRMLHHAFNQPPAKTITPVRGHDEHVANPANCSAVRHDAGESHLFLASIHTKTERILN